MNIRDELTRVDGKPITVKDVLELLKVQGVFRNAIYQLIELEVVRREANRRELTVSDAELEPVLVVKRRYLGLESATAMDDHCRRNGIRWENWKQAVADDVLRGKLKEAVFTIAEVEKYFENNKKRLCMLSVGRIVCQSEKKALELQDRINRGKAAFAAMAREFSLENNTKMAGGHLGCFKLGTFSLQIEEDLLAAGENVVTGPYQQNSHWVIYRVEEYVRTELTNETRNHITSKLFAEWLHNQVVNTRR